MIQELEGVILESDLSQSGLQREDIGTVVLVHQKGKEYEVECTALARRLRLSWCRLLKLAQPTGIRLPMR